MVPAAGRLEMGDGELGDDEHAGQVDVDHRPPGLDRHVGDRVFGFGIGGGVEHGVDLAERRDRFLPARRIPRRRR